MKTKNCSNRKLYENNLNYVCSESDQSNDRFKYCNYNNSHQSKLRNFPKYRFFFTNINKIQDVFYEIIQFKIQSKIIPRDTLDTKC